MLLQAFQLKYRGAKNTGAGFFARDVPDRARFRRNWMPLGLVSILMNRDADCLAVYAVLED